MLPKSRKTSSAIVSLSAVGALFLAACSTSSPGNAASGGSASGGAISQFTVGMDPAPTTLNYAKSNIGYQLGGLSLEPLLIAKKSGKLKRWLAQSGTPEKPTPTASHITPGGR